MSKINKTFKTIFPFLSLKLFKTDYFSGIKNEKFIGQVSYERVN